MSEYPKIKTLFERDLEDMKHIIPGVFTDTSYLLVKHWLVTEKIDGMNVRVVYEDEKVRFGGKTDNAQMPTTLLDKLTELFPANLIAKAFPTKDNPPRVVLYGEGYGPKIQKGGGDYRSDPHFRLFDVVVWGVDGAGNPKPWWLDWSDVEDVSRKLGIKTVPLLSKGASLEKALELVVHPSWVSWSEGASRRDQEGIVCRTDPLLFTRRGHRLIWKLKARDLKSSLTDPTGVGTILENQ